MQIESENNPINKIMIKEFENTLEIELAQKYKEFLLKYNGGEPEYYIFNKNLNLGSIVVNILYGIQTNNDFDDLEKTNQIFENRIHKSFITIGDDPGGNQFLLGVKGKFKGKIYFWDHNTELDNDVFVENELPGNMYLLTDNFNEFIEKLEEDPEA